MSKNQIFKIKSLSKLHSPLSNISRKLTPSSSFCADKALKLCYFPAYSLSKNREGLVSNSRIDLSKTVPSQESESSKYPLTKQSTQSTESFSGRCKEINSLEFRINSMNLSKSAKEQFQELQTIISDLGKLMNPISGLLLLIQNKTADYVNYLENQLSIFSTDKAILEESLHSFVNLKKRFKKLAIENLEISSLLKEKDSKCSTMKEKLKNLKKILEDEISEKNRLNLQLQDALADFREKTQRKKRKISILKPHVKVLKKIIKLVQKPAYEELKNEIIALTGTLQNFNLENSSFEQSGLDCNTLNLPSSCSNFCSFFSNTDQNEGFLLSSSRAF